MASVTPEYPSRFVGGPELVSVNISMAAPPVGVWVQAIVIPVTPMSTFESHTIVAGDPIRSGFDDGVTDCTAICDVTENKEKSLVVYMSYSLCK